MQFAILEEEDVSYFDDILMENGKPKVVIANWVTQIYKPGDIQGNVYGVNEEWLIKKVDCFIHIGNKSPHKKRILSKPHKEYQFPWLHSRAIDQKHNVIYVWGE